MSEVTFTIKATMNKRWVNHFISFLKRMEANGVIGHSEKVAFYADGDGDFSPMFDIDEDVVWIEKRPALKKIEEELPVYDAG